MRTFHCQHCGQAVFFENVQCLKCGSKLAFMPDRLNMGALEPMPGQDGLWRPRVHGDRKASGQYRLCQNATTQNACNFAVPDTDPNHLCASCRLTRVLPDLSQPGNTERWFRLESAKRRLFYTLAKLGLLSPTPANGEADGPVFEFLADLPGQQVMTGHKQGLITLNVAEADDAERVKRKVQMREPYRTLLGHFRHEAGHYYWDPLILEGKRVDDFRKVFGDESRNYSQALHEHYARGGAIPDWQDNYVSAYATAHPWEDWAETWAHYLHMVDLLETAAAYNTRVTIPGQGLELDEVINPLETGAPEFNLLVEQWVPLTLLVNSLNRSLGQEDAYPFALSPGALNKLRFVHDIIGECRARPRQPAARRPAKPPLAQSVAAAATVAEQSRQKPAAAPEPQG